MEGIDVTPEELTHAKKFLEMTNNHFSGRRMVDGEQIVWLLAWYGSIRGKGVPPCELVCKNKEKSNGTT